MKSWGTFVLFWRATLQVVFNRTALLLSWNPTATHCVHLSLPQCCTALAFGLGGALDLKGSHDGNAGIHMLPCWREFRQSHAGFTCSPVFTGDSAATPCLTPLIMSKPWMTQQLIFSSNASLTNGLKNRRWGWIKGLNSPHHEVARTSGEVKSVTSY